MHPDRGVCGNTPGVWRCRWWRGGKAVWVSGWSEVMMTGAWPWRRRHHGGTTEAEVEGEVDGGVVGEAGEREVDLTGGVFGR